VLLLTSLAGCVHGLHFLQCAPLGRWELRGDCLSGRRLLKTCAQPRLERGRAVCSRRVLTNPPGWPVYLGFLWYCCPLSGAGQFTVRQTLMAQGRVYALLPHSPLKGSLQGAGAASPRTTQPCLHRSVHASC
jgi:hypothetical protein